MDETVFPCEIVLSPIFEVSVYATKIIRLMGWPVCAAGRCRTVLFGDESREHELAVLRTGLSGRDKIR
ncbi:hypothetical protein D3C81_2206400 [compost metagenome]